MLHLPIITHEYVMRGFGEITDIDFSLAEYLLERMKCNPDYNLIEAETMNTVSNRALLKQIVSVAESLKSRGVKPDDVIGICSENRLEYFVPVVAVLSIGATVVTLNPLYSTDELKHVISISRPNIMFCSPFTALKMKEVQTFFPFLHELIFFDAGDTCDGFTRYTQLLETYAAVDSFQCAEVNPRESVAVILCSSGTTGLPKCVQLTHSNVLCFFNIARTLQNTSDTSDNNTDNDVTLGLIPFFHGYGFCILLASVAYNRKMVIMSRFEEKAFLSSIEKYKIKSLFVVPPIIVFLAKHPLVKKYDLSSLNTVVSGAAPLSKDVQYAAQNRLKLPSEIRQGYGMTELSVSTTMMPSNISRVGSVGFVVPGMECKVINTETGKPLPPFNEGEVCFKGPFVMKGYKNNPAATEEVIDSEGWLHTGDVGYYDEQGFLFIVDRLKELIKFKGFQVAPAELEALLLTNPKVKDAGVIGLPNEEAGELPMAFIVKQPGVEMTEEEVKKFIAGKVSPQKRLHVIMFVNEIPKNPSGKILRKELRKMIKKAKL